MLMNSNALGSELRCYSMSMQVSLNNTGVYHFFDIGCQHDYCNAPSREGVRYV